MNAYIFNKPSQIKIPQYVKIVIYHEQVCFIPRMQAGSTFKSQSVSFIIYLMLSVFTTIK